MIILFLISLPSDTDGNAQAAMVIRWLKQMVTRGKFLLCSKVFENTHSDLLVIYLFCYISV